MGGNVNQLRSIRNCKAVTPSDSVALTTNGGGTLRCRSISVAVAGNVSFLGEDGVNSVATGLVAGILYPISTTRINSTNTTATGIVAYW